MTKERPILFSAPMVRALLAGSKTQTRRIAKFSDPVDYPGMAGAKVVNLGGKTYWLNSQKDHPQHISKASPYGQPGDRLWVRESWQLHSTATDLATVVYAASSRQSWTEMHRLFPVELASGLVAKPFQEGWRPSIHMPRWASRILLEIVSVRVERLQAISEADALAEGCERLDSERTDRDMKLCPTCGGTGLHAVLGGNGGVIPDCDCRDCDTYVKRYKHLWEAINGPGSWDANPWVWVVEFKIVEED